jgi:hypothetical protein
MGFNARLAPYSVAKEVHFQTNTNTDTFERDHFIFRFPFAGQLIGAYAALGMSAEVVDADTTTCLYEVSLWKNSADNTTATYDTADRAAKRTGEVNATGGILWASNTTYALTNLTAARRKFAAGDKMFLRTGFTANTQHVGSDNELQGERLEIQADYIIGHEA